MEQLLSAGAVLFVVLFVLLIFVIVLRELGKAPDLTQMSNDDLVHYSYNAAMHGDYPNIYSEEYARRHNHI